MLISEKIKKISPIKDMDHNFRDCGSVGCEINFVNSNDWADFVGWLGANWVSFGNYGDITGFSYNGKNKSVFIDFK